MQNYNNNYDEYFIFDVTQLKEYGRKYFEGEGYSFRYTKYKRLIFNVIYIPFGPIVKDLESFKRFLNYLDSLILTKVIIELPRIENENIVLKVKTMLSEHRYKNTSNIQDGETLVIDKSNYMLSSKDQRYIRNAEKAYDCDVILSPSEDLIKSIYPIYEQMGINRKFNIKPIEAFLASPNKVISICKNRLNSSIDNFLLGSIFTRNSKKIFYSLFTAQTKEGFDNKLGYMSHKYMFDKLLNENIVDEIDFHGADRSKRTYVEFKSRFGGKFIQYPGSYAKTIIL